MYESKCPACGHVLMWSVGKLRKRIFRRRKLAKVKYWFCSVGEGEHWSVPFCGCRHEAHILHR